MDGGQKSVLANEPDALDLNDDESTRADSVNAHDIKVWVREVLNWIVKLLPVIATVLAAFVANEYKASLTTSTLLSEREKADSQLRSEMFAQLVDPISAARSDTGVSLEREQLLAEMLSLNFHEHINLRPLLSHVDARLSHAIAVASGTEAMELRATRRSFRAVAKAVISRQTAMLTRSEGSKGGGAQLQQIDIGMLIPDGAALTTWMKPLFERMKSRKVQPAVFGKPFELLNSAQTHRLYFIVEQPNWDSETFQVSVSIFSVDAGGQDVNELAQRDFELSWFDFPLTENTLLADGTRFSIVLDQIYDAREQFSETAMAQTSADGVRRAKISVVWFPQDYIAARERPTNYREFRRSLGLNQR